MKAESVKQFTLISYYTTQYVMKIVITNCYVCKYKYQMYHYHNTVAFILEYHHKKIWREQSV